MFRSMKNNVLTILVLVFLCMAGHTHAFSQRPAFVFRAAIESEFAPSCAPLFMSSGPAILDRPATVEDIDVSEDKKTEKDSKLGGEAFEIRLFNDPFNKREFVARCLATICGKSDTESYQIMMHAHKHGMGVVGRYQFEIAELYYNSLRENGLMVDMVQVDDE